MSEADAASKAFLRLGNTLNLSSARTTADLRDSGTSRVSQSTRVRKTPSVLLSVITLYRSLQRVFRRHI